MNDGVRRFVSKRGVRIHKIILICCQTIKPVFLFLHPGIFLFSSSFQEQSFDYFGCVSDLLSLYDLQPVTENVNFGLLFGFDVPYLDSLFSSSHTYQTGQKKD